MPTSQRFIPRAGHATGPTPLACLLGALVAATGFGFIPATGWAQKAAPLTVITHPVIRNVITGPAGQNAGVIDEWLQARGTAINWVALDIPPLHDRLFRELSLRSTSIDLAFFLDRYASPTHLQLFEPLDNCLAKPPALEDPADIAAPLVAALKVGSTSHALPYRHATNALFYNEDLLKERGLEGPPKTIEALLDYARKLTYTRSDGTAVHGLALSGDSPAPTLNLLLAQGAPLFNDQGVPAADTPAFAQGIGNLARLYADGVLPRNFTAVGIDYQIAGMQRGRLAMTIQPFARYMTYNAAGKSDFAGRIHAAPVPGTSGQPAAQTEFWSVAIPKNSARKGEACELIKALMGREATIRAALNGNGPTRLSTYRDTRVAAKLPYAAAEEASLRVARLTSPPLESIGRLMETYMETMQSVTLGMQSVQKAAPELQRKLQEQMKRP